jgi:hypothetical protein
MPAGGSMKEWDELDFIAAGGMLFMAGSAVASLFPPLRRVWMLAPVAIGVGLMAIAAFGARRR